ncbi:MAG: hypothetical protein SGI72_01710 [Planctomycetota bacterium]|nr:hypothetical protein [Planctomycetota bacterium]
MLSAGDAAAFGSTVALELPICAWLTREGWMRTAVFCLLMNGATWFTLHAVLTRWNGPVYPLEFAVIAVEALLIRWCFAVSIVRACCTSTAMNLTSWLVGTFLLAQLWSTR